jgi:hypothetical protein
MYQLHAHSSFQKRTYQRCPSSVICPSRVEPKQKAALITAMTTLGAYKCFSTRRRVTWVSREDCIEHMQPCGL